MSVLRLLAGGAAGFIVAVLLVAVFRVLQILGRPCSDCGQPTVDCRCPDPTDPDDDFAESVRWGFVTPVDWDDEPQTPRPSKEVA